MLKDLPYLGRLFKSMVIRDLRIQSQPLNGTVMHYSDDRGGEADGRWAAIEVKLGAAATDQGAASLIRLTTQITGPSHLPGV